MHNVFLSYEYGHDAARAASIRLAWLAHGGTATLESAKARSDRDIRRWIDRHLETAAATIVLVGSHTASSKWVAYEIQRSKALGKGLLGIDVRGMQARQAGSRCQPMPMLAGYSLYDWVKDDGERNLACWVSEAVSLAYQQSSPMASRS